MGLEDEGVAGVDEVFFAHVGCAHVWGGEAEAVAGFPAEGEGPGVLGEDGLEGFGGGEVEA